MNIQDLRQSLKQKWLCYYQQNCHWLEKMQIWAEYNGERRPLSSFVLATVTILEPNLVDLLPLLVDLNTNTDAIIAALGLNFNPEQLLRQLDDNSNNQEPLQETSYKHPQNGRVLEITTHSLSNSLLQQSLSGAVQDRLNHRNSSTYVQVKASKSLIATKYRIPLSAVAIAPPISDIDCKIKSGTVKSEVTESSTMNRRKLANWIDEFCQGRDWDRDESIFITF